MVACTVVAMETGEIASPFVGRIDANHATRRRKVLPPIN